MNIDQFFTPQSMFTLFGSSTIVTIVTNVFQYLTGKNPKWAAFIISLILSVGGVLYIGGKEVIDFVVGIVNGFLIFSTAIGFNTLTGKNHDNRGGDTPKTFTGVGDKKGRANSRSFNAKWF